jgi:hypothetical protein
MAAMRPGSVFIEGFAGHGDIFPCPRTIGFPCSFDPDPDSDPDTDVPTVG